VLVGPGDNHIGAIVSKKSLLPGRGVDNQVSIEDLSARLRKERV
jgi:hypothetical protein